MLTGMRRRRASADLGAGSAELAVATPLLMLLVLLVVQFAVWAHATGVAQATAAERWSPPASRGGTAVSGQQRAARVRPIGPPVRAAA